MKATYSPSIGVCVFSTTTEVPELVFAPESVRLSAAVDRPVLSLAGDWTVAECANVDEILQVTCDAYYLERARSLAQICMSLDDPDLVRDVLGEIESELATHVNPDSLVARLLLAPLLELGPLQGLAEQALSLGFAATASTLKRVLELQPLLRRFVGYWLDIPSRLFVNGTFSRQKLWERLVSSGQIPRMLQAPSRQDFSNLFATLFFTEPNMARRKAIVQIAHDMAERLHLGDDSLPADLSLNEESKEDQEPESNVAAHVAYKRAMSQIKAIAKAVAEGKDNRAKQIMEELVRKQAASSSGVKYAIKSLCNIAQRCADMFRTDFERTALEKAIDLDPRDGWTLVQFGDHLKRVGEYEAAERTYRQVINTAGADVSVAARALADVYAHRGEFDTAIALYKDIPNWETVPEVRTAIADNLRRSGSFNAAREAYEKLESEGLGSSRSEAGKAEIAKHMGNLPLAEAIYRRIISHEVDQENGWVYKLALVGILKQQFKLDDAYRIVESLIAEFPFLMQARLLRAAILGLMDKEQSGLEGLPDPGKPRAYREWLHQYYRGLLLLKLGRYDDAKRRLLENLNSALLTGEEREILRLAATYALLAKEETSEADQLLENVGTVHDLYVEHLRKILQLHIAVVRRDQKRKDELLSALKGVTGEDENLSHAVLELERGNVDQAHRYELKAFLALAA